jgi:hypothetical protein
MDNVQKHNICTNVPSSQTLDLIYISQHEQDISEGTYVTSKASLII